MNDPLLRGHAIARMLSGLWRTSAQVPNPSTDLVGPALKLGLGGLLGRCLTTPTPRDLRPLRDEYRALATMAIRHERMLANAVQVLRTAGIEPIVVKGLAVARHYPDAGCRPCGDIDLCVPVGSLTTAIQALEQSGLAAGFIDLHEGVPDLPHRSWNQLFARSTMFSVAGLDVRTLGAEDLLTLVCLHFVRHLGERPLWLCDVAVLLEQLPATFDWNRCWAGSRSHACWVAVVVALAQSLLGARPTHQPTLILQPPSWFTKAIVQRWGDLSLDRKPRNRFHPIRAAWRLGIGPGRSATLFQLAAVFLWPVQWGVRIVRHLRPRPQFAFDVHQVRRL